MHIYQQKGIWIQTKTVEEIPANKIKEQILGFYEPTVLSIVQWVFLIVWFFSPKLDNEASHSDVNIGKMSSTNLPI